MQQSNQLVKPWPQLVLEVLHCELFWLVPQPVAQDSNEEQNSPKIP